MVRKLKQSLIYCSIVIIILILLTGCIDKSEVITKSREFIKEYIHNPETIQFNDENIVGAWNGYDIYGSGTVMYEGTRQSFSYWIFMGDNNKFVVKQLIIGDI